MSLCIWERKNKVSKIMKNMIAGTEVANSRKNHSARKTLVRNLKSARVPKSSIIKVTGQTTTAGLGNISLEHYNPRMDRSSH